MYDRRLHELRELIDSGDFDLLSLDLFDTLLYRTVPAPTDLFFLLGQELMERGRLYPSSSPESFHRERVDAEHRARRRAALRRNGIPGAMEVTLDEIYAEFPAGYLRGIAAHDVAPLEFALETRVVRVNPDLSDLISHARARGLRIAFVSDTYLTATQIDALVGLEADHRILSGEEGRPKALGLHEVLVERSGIPPHRILHVGNDVRADVDGPAQFGIRTHLFRVWPEPFEEMIARELPATLSDRAELLAGPDGGLTTLRSLAMNRVDGAYAEWGAGVLGPLVTGFADWVTARCTDLGIRHVLCLMREGRVFKETIDALGGAESSLVTREIYVSRYAVRRASLFTGSADELARFLNRPSPTPRRALLEQLGLPADSDAPSDPDELLGSKKAMELARRLSRNAGLRGRIVAASARARANLLVHLAAGLDGARPESVALVDLGYKGTIQEGLQKILDHEGWPVRTHGLYLVTGGDVHETQATGAAVEGWLAENGQPVAIAHTFMRSPEFVEQSLMAPCGTTLGHDEDGMPLLDEPRVPAEQRARIDDVQRGIAAWTTIWAERGERCAQRAASARRRFQAMAIRAVARPLPIELDLFGDWTHDENFGSARCRRLADVDGLDPWEGSHMSAHQLASLPAKRLYWPFGFAHRIGASLGEAVAGIYLRTVDPRTFDASSDGNILVAYWDTGQGFNAEEAGIRRYRVSQRGTVWQRFSVRPKPGETPPRALGVTIGMKDQIIRLAGIRVTSRDVATGTLSERRIPHEAIDRHGYRHLGQGLYLVEEDPALLVVPFDTVVDAAREVDVDLFFGHIPGAA